MMGVMKKLFVAGTSLLAYLSFALPASAQINICPNTAGSGQDFRGLCNLANANIGSVVSRIIVIMLIIAVLISLFFLIWGGIKWILSGGDKSGVEAARNHVIAAIVGLVISFLAFFILTIISQIFGVSVANLDIPSLRLVP